jgi:histidinol-phosphate aminotransferase
MLTPKKTIEEMAPYIGPGENRIEYLRLDFNENVLGPSPKVLEALRAVTRAEYGCYPEYENLIAALSGFLKVPDTCILPTNGSDEAIRSLFDAYVEKEDEVILLVPSYSMYEIYAGVAGCKIVWVPYPEDFSFPIEAVLKAIGPKTRLIALANPNNPTGTLIAREDLVKIIEANSNMVVLIDEAYGRFARTTEIDLSLQYPNVFVSQTFSKAQGLAGLRIGYLISRQENTAVLSKILSPAYTVDCLAAVAVQAAIEDDAYTEAYVETTIAVREKFARDVESLGFKVVPSQANFLLIRFGGQAEKFKSILSAEKILVRERSDLLGFLRITIGTQEQMDRVLRCLRPALIFDMDGVLVDESRSYRFCIVKTVEYFLKKTISPQLVETLKEKGGYNNDYDCVDAILAEYGCQVLREEIIDRFDAYYEELKFSERWLIDEENLLKLKKDYRLGIFTGRPKKDAIDALRRFEKEKLFDVVITDDDVSKRKPDPEGLILAMSQLGAFDAIYVGDSPDDKEAARRASAKFIEVGGLCEL